MRNESDFDRDDPRPVFEILHAITEEQAGSSRIEGSYIRALTWDDAVRQASELGVWLDGMLVEEGAWLDESEWWKSGGPEPWKYEGPELEAPTLAQCRECMVPTVIASSFKAPSAVGDVSICNECMARKGWQRADAESIEALGQRIANLTSERDALLEHVDRPCLAGCEECGAIACVEVRDTAEAGVGRWCDHCHRDLGGFR